MPKCRIYCNVLQKCNIRTNFCECFAILLNENPTHAVFFHAACWLLYGPKQAHTFSAVTPLAVRRFAAGFFKEFLHLWDVVRTFGEFV